MTNATNPSLGDQAEALLVLLKSFPPDQEPLNINDFVHRLLAHYREIAIIWAIEDVQGIRSDLTADQAWEVLERAGDKHDAQYGVSWTTLECVAEDLFGYAPETDEATEA